MTTASKYQTKVPFIGGINHGKLTDNICGVKHEIPLVVLFQETGNPDGTVGYWDEETGEFIPESGWRIAHETYNLEVFHFTTFGVVHVVYAYVVDRMERDEARNHLLGMVVADLFKE